MSQPERYRPVLVSKDKVEMQQCISGDWTSLSCYYLLHDRVVRAEDNCAALAAENERLRKAGDVLADVYCESIFREMTQSERSRIPSVAQWLAAKEGRDAK